MIYIRNIEPNDVESIYNIENDVFSEKEKYDEELLNFFCSNNLGIVAIIDNNIVGYLLYLQTKYENEIDYN